MANQVRRDELHIVTEGLKSLKEDGDKEYKEYHARIAAHDKRMQGKTKSIGENRKSLMYLRKELQKAGDAFKLENG